MRYEVVFMKLLKEIYSYKANDGGGRTHNTSVA